MSEKGREREEKKRRLRRKEGRMLACLIEGTGEERGIEELKS